MNSCAENMRDSNDANTSQGCAARAASQVSPRAVLATVCLAQFMVPLMFTSVGVALPSMGRELGASAMQLSLVEQAYALALAMAMLTFGRMGDVFGRRRVFLGGLSLFSALTLALSLAQNIWLLIFLRWAQGVGAAMLLSGSLALVASVFPPEVRGQKIGVVSALTYTGLTAGPLLGGFLTTALGWRSVFWTVVPLGLLAVFLCLTRMRGEWKEAHGESMDWTGSLVYSASLALFTFGAAHLADGVEGWGLTLAGSLGFAFFVRRESRTTHPLLDVSLLRSNRFFTLSCLAAMGMYAATFGYTFFMSLALQYSHDLTPLEAGLVLLIQPLMQVVVSPAIGRMTDRGSPARLANIGMVVNCAGLLLAVFFAGPQAHLGLIALDLAIVGLGTGIFVTPNSTAIMASVDRRQFGVASGMIGTVRTLGLVISMTTASLVLSLFLGSQTVTAETLPGFLASMRTCLAIYGVLSVCGLSVALGRAGRGKAAPPAA
jgi:EmrB/QacA subfamily drug resistance transporter